MVWFVAVVVKPEFRPYGGILPIDIGGETEYRGRRQSGRLKDEACPPLAGGSECRMNDSNGKQLQPRMNADERRYERQTTASTLSSGKATVRPCGLCVPARGGQALWHRAPLRRYHQCYQCLPAEASAKAGNPWFAVALRCIAKRTRRTASRPRTAGVSSQRPATATDLSEEARKA